ncbi:MAG: C39 family peptidase [Candidatus Promineifilaceae bacterium]
MKQLRLVLSILALLLFVLILPPVQSTLVRGAKLFWSVVQQQQNPPQEVVFVPSAPTVTTAVSALPTNTLAPVAVATQLIEPTVEATAAPTTIPTPTAIPLPSSAAIDGVQYQDQHGLWNYCGPSNLAMLLTYWGDETDRLEAGGFMRGTPERYDDKNVSPSEMGHFVANHSELTIIVRHGGTFALLKRLISAEIPVIIEAGYLPEGEAWMGHYLLLTGYDDAAQQFISQDTYIGVDTPYSYAYVDEHWRAFNNQFIVAVDQDNQAILMEALGDWADEDWALAQAKAVAEEEIGLFSAETPAHFYALFNLGTTLTAQEKYAEAATAFDRAFAAYAQLPTESRPWRMLWYQFKPYTAYYETGRYQDVINLANTTLSTLSEPMLEESLYWRGLARKALGDAAGAQADLDQVQRLNPNFVGFQ